MILPIVAYGDPVLRKVAQPIAKTYAHLPDLIDNMKETMQHAGGVGLAAPQIGLSLRLFVVDASPLADSKELTVQEQAFLKTFKKTFINAKIIEESGEEWAYNEGCLSIPEIREDVYRKPKLKIEYYDLDFKKQVETFSGVAARIIQHEYDHLEGILFTDKISSFKRRLLQGKLKRISRGKIKPDYPMSFPKRK